MNARGSSTRTQRGSPKRLPSANLLRPSDSNKSEAARSSRIKTSKFPLASDDVVFDAKVFLAIPGLGRTIVNLGKSDVAYAQGDPANAVYYVQKGRLRVTVTSPNGKEATITLVGPAEFLGESCMISAHPLRLATATAMTDCALLKISKAEMSRVLYEEPALSEMFVAFLLARNARIESDLVDQLFNSSEKRLARILLLLAQFGKESKPETVVPKISQELLAEMIGTTRSRVSFFMNRFRKLGFIEYNGEIRVHNTLLNIFLQE